MKKHYHFIGIGGTGLAPMARILLEQGNVVSGSDIFISPLAEELRRKGAIVYLGHKGEQVAGADIVIRSSAIQEDNPEIQGAKSCGIPILRRADFLHELTFHNIVIAIAGTHGKTTTTAMTAWVLEEAGIDPSYIIGGTSKNLMSNAHAGKGAHFVIEADEYDSMFLGLSPSYLILTIVEYDHPDCYPTQDAYLDAFKKLIMKMENNAILLVNADHKQTRDIGKWAEQYRKVLYYGASPQANYQILKRYSKGQSGTSFQLQFPNGKLHMQKLLIPGDHNIQNAAAVLALADCLGLATQSISEALEKFTGTNRRFDILGTFAGITLIDDYGHHPTELHSTIDAARQYYPDQRLITVWQPHTYSRTQALFQEYLDAFNASDMVIVTEIYASREHHQNYSAKLVADQIHHPDVHFIATLEDVEKFLLKELKNGDVLLIFSAGDANQINQHIASILQERGA